MKKKNTLNLKQNEIYLLWDVLEDAKNLKASSLGFVDNYRYEYQQRQVAKIDSLMEKLSKLVH